MSKLGNQSKLFTTEGGALLVAVVAGRRKGSMKNSNGLLQIAASPRGPLYSLSGKPQFGYNIGGMPAGLPMG